MGLRILGDAFLALLVAAINEDASEGDDVHAHDRRAFPRVTREDNPCAYTNDHQANDEAQPEPFVRTAGRPPMVVFSSS